MKFFKHFTDAHRGKSLQSILNNFKDKDTGMKAIGIYWTLVELCAEKMNKHRDEEYGEKHCVFEFSIGYLKNTLRTHQTKNLLMYLQCFTDVRLMSFQCSPDVPPMSSDVLTIYMPKLLESLDRDVARTRPARGQIRQEKEKEKEKDYSAQNNLNNSKAGGRGAHWRLQAGIAKEVIDQTSEGQEGNLDFIQSKLDDKLYKLVVKAGIRKIRKVGEGPMQKQLIAEMLQVADAMIQKGI